MPDVRVTLTGQNIPAARLKKFLEAAVRLGFEVQVDDLSAGAENLAGYLRTALDRRFHLHFSDCFRPYENLSLMRAAGTTLENFMLRREHRPFKGCACLHLQTAIIQLVWTRGLHFADCAPALVFSTLLETTPFEMRTYNVLKREGLAWTEQVGYLRQQDIMAMRSASEGVVADIQRCLGKQLLPRW